MHVVKNSNADSHVASVDCPFRKPKLPIEMEYTCQTQDDDETSEGEDTYAWNPEQLLQHAKAMFQLKEKIYQRVKTNIDMAQKKDKFYYDKKHSDPRVLNAT